MYAAVLPMTVYLAGHNVLPIEGAQTVHIWRRMSSVLYLITTPVSTQNISMYVWTSLALSGQFVVALNNSHQEHCAVYCKRTLTSYYFS